VKLSFRPNLEPGDVISNDRLREIFKCSLQGGMRRSHKTNSLVLISDHTKSIYENRWIKVVFHYSGIGVKGVQDLNFGQNKTLNESSSNKVDLFLFEVFESGRYIFTGRVALAGEPYTASHPDINGDCRTVWIFPLKISGGKAAYKIAEELFQKNHRRKRRLARRLSDKELINKATIPAAKVGSRRTSATKYDKNVYVAELARRKAKGVCQLCEQPAPFKDKYGNPYLEPHHIVWISQAGEDTIENTVALCPNCHAKMHKLNLKSDRNKLKKIAASNTYQYTLFGEVIFC
jgi:5-methylcytosine-specific restriction protein A